MSSPSFLSTHKGARCCASTREATEIKVKMPLTLINCDFIAILPTYIWWILVYSITLTDARNVLFLSFQIIYFWVVTILIARMTITLINEVLSNPLLNTTFISAHLLSKENEAEIWSLVSTDHYLAALIWRGHGKLLLTSYPEGHTEVTQKNSGSSQGVLDTSLKPTQCVHSPGHLGQPLGQRSSSPWGSKVQSYLRKSKPP